ncbi:MAG TPA: hypothetical protein VGI07_11415, partial [Solirubrobacteraceae bacterium]
MRQRLLVAAAVWIAAAVGVMVSAPAGQAATTASTPVNLTTPIDVGAARASSAATVLAGDARFQVLGAGLIRMEYAPSGQFEDAPTVNALYRRFAVPSFHVERSGG